MRVLGGEGRNGHDERHPETPRQKGGVFGSISRVSSSRQPSPTRELLYTVHRVFPSVLRWYI